MLVAGGWRLRVAWFVNLLDLGLVPSRGMLLQDLGFISRVPQVVTFMDQSN